MNLAFAAINESPTLPSGFNYGAAGLGIRVFTQPGSRTDQQQVCLMRPLIPT